MGRCNLIEANITLVWSISLSNFGNQYKPFKEYLLRNNIITKTIVYQYYSGICFDIHVGCIHLITEIKEKLESNRKNLC